MESSHLIPGYLEVTALDEETAGLSSDIGNDNLVQ